MSESEISVSELSGVLHTWLDCDVEELEFELPSGKMATDLLVTKEKAIFRASEKFGDGFTPYADSPDAHREYLECEDLAETEGAVEYILENGSIELPKILFFEQEVFFSEPITSTSPEEIASRLQEELNTISEISQDISVVPPDIENEDQRVINYKRE